MGIFDPQPLPSSPTSQSTTSGSVASWAQPYVTNMLNQGQQLTNQGSTGFQNQVYDSAANMQTPGQFAQGSNFLNQSGQGMLGTTGSAMTYGQQGAGYGQQATGAGQAYQNMATDPSQIQKYMNPYIQQALNPQLQLLNQQQALQGQGIAAKAAGQGAFGGNRAALAQGLNAQNYALAGQQAIGQGYSDAFKAAQQAQQFGSDLGLRGLQTGIQGAQTGLQGVDTAQRGYAGATQAGVGLGNIGAQQGQYDLGRLSLQNTIANQQYNLPYQRLQYMQGLLSGLPVTTSTTQGYGAQPNRAAQIGGTLGTLATYGNDIFNMGKNIYGAFTGGGDGSSGTLGNIFDDDGNLMPSLAEGGGVKHYAEGGITSINRRVMNDPTAYSEQTINRGAQNNVLGGVTKLLALDTIAKQRAAMQQQQAMQAQQAQPILAQLQQQAMPQQIMQGIDSAQSNLPQQYAGGGIIAFEEGGTAKSAFREDLSRFGDYAVPNLGIIKKLKELGSYFTTPRQPPTDADAQPGGLYGSGSNVAPEIQAKPKIDTSGIVIHPNAPRAAGPAASPAPQIPTTPAYKPAETSGIDKLIKGYEEMIRGGDDFKQAESKAETNAMRKFFLGMMANKPGSSLVSAIGDSGTAAQEGLEKTQEAIQGRKDKQIIQLMGLGLKGEDLKNAAKKMGIDEAELQAKLPMYSAAATKDLSMAQYYRDAKGRSTGTGLGGSLGEATVDKIMERFDSYRQDYKNPNNPYVAMLTPQDQLYLKEGKGKSLATARRKLDELIDMEQQKRLNTLSGYKQKRPVE
jgi:hypothetical protein